jgi:hypothetical protein
MRNMTRVMPVNEPDLLVDVGEKPGWFREQFPRTLHRRTDLKDFCTWVVCDELTPAIREQAR